MAAYEVLLLNTAVPQIQAAQSGDTYVVPRDIAFSAALTLSAGTANGVPYLSSPGKVLTTGSALTFDGTNLFTVAAATPKIRVSDSGLAADFGLDFYFPSVASSYGQVTLNGATGGMRFVAGKAGSTGYYQAFELNGSEQMRLTSTGLGIGTNNPGQKLHVVGASGSGDVQIGTNAGANQYQYITFGGSNGGTDFGWQIGRSSNTSGIGGNGALYFYDIKANANRMSIDSSGNLGLGVTPSAWTLFKVLEIGNAGTFISGRPSGNQLNIGVNSYYNSGSKYANTGVAVTMYEQEAGAHKWYNAASGTAGDPITFIERAQISSDGTFRVKGAGTAGTTDAVQFSGSAPASAMTLDASGNLLVGTALSGGRITADGNDLYYSGYFTQGLATSNCIAVHNRATTGDNQFIQFATEATLTARGSIVYNRGAGLTQYNTTSDYRAKDIIGPVTDSGALIDSVPVYMGKMKGATQERPMFIAHEVPAYAHTGEKDAVDADGNPVYQQMDASALIPVMWAEIQSLRQRLAAAGI